MERQIHIEMTEIVRYARYARNCSAGVTPKQGNETSNINDGNKTLPAGRRAEDTRREEDWLPNIDWDKELKDKDRECSVFCVVRTIYFELFLPLMFFIVVVFVLFIFFFLILVVGYLILYLYGKDVSDDFVRAVFVCCILSCIFSCIVCASVFS